MLFAGRFIALAINYTNFRVEKQQNRSSIGEQFKEQKYLLQYKFEFIPAHPMRSAKQRLFSYNSRFGNP
jgi:hypothetical protein